VAARAPPIPTQPHPVGLVLFRLPCWRNPAFKPWGASGVFGSGKAGRLASWCIGPVSSADDDGGCADWDLATLCTPSPGTALLMPSPSSAARQRSWNGPPRNCEPIASYSLKTPISPRSCWHEGVLDKWPPDWVGRQQLYWASVGGSEPFGRFCLPPCATWRLEFVHRHRTDRAAHIGELLGAEHRARRRPSFSSRRRPAQASRVDLGQIHEGGQKPSALMPE